MNVNVEYIKLNDGSIRVCCGGKCPIIEKDEKYVYITDDYGQTIKMTFEEALALSNGVEQL